MPITLDYKQRALSLAGLSPDQWDVSEDGNNFIKKQPVQQQEPTVVSDIALNPLMDTKASDSPLQTAGKTLLDTAPSAAVGGVGAASTLALLSGLGLDMTGVGAIAGIPLTLLGGGLAGYGTRKLQNKVIPMVDPNYEPDLQKSQVTNPNAAALGDLASIPLGGFNPGLGGVRALGGLGKLAVGMRPTAGEVGDILNTGIGATGSAVGTAVQGDTNPEDLLKSALTGAAFSSPNALGKRMGFQHGVDLNPINSPDLLRDALQNGTPQQAQQQPTTNTDELQLNPIGTTDITTTAGLNPNAKEFETIAQTALSKYKTAEDNQGQLDNMAGEGGIVPSSEASVKAQTVAAQDPEQSRAAILQVAGEAQPKGMTQVVNTPQGKVWFNPDKTTPKEVLEEFSKPNGGGKLLGMSTNTKVVTPDSVAVTSKNEEGTPVTDEVVTPEQVPAAIENAQKNGNEVEVKKPEEVLQQRTQDTALEDAAKAREALNNKQYQPSTNLGGEVSEKLKEQEIPTKPTTEWYNLLKHFGATMKGVITSEDGNLVHDQTKAPVNGVAVVQDGLRQVILNPNRAAIDTQPHEMMHIFLHDMENSPSQKDKALTKRLTELTKQSPEYMAAHLDGGTPQDMNEFITSQQGLEFLKQQLNLSKESPWRKWYGDFAAHVNQKFGKNSSLEDVRRLMNYKFVNDKVKGINLSNGVAQYQQPTEDGKKFEEVVKQMEQVEPFGDEFMKLWKEKEEIKNRHKGMTPEQGLYQPESELNPKTGKPYSKNQARIRSQQKEAFGEVPDRTNARFADLGHTEEHKRIPLDLKKDDIVDKEGKISNKTVDEIGRVANSKLNWLYRQFQKNTGKAFDVVHNKTGKDYLAVPENMRRSELLARLNEDLISKGLDSDGLVPTVRRRIRSIFDKAIADYKPEVSLNQKNKVTGNEMQDSFAAKQEGAVSEEPPVRSQVQDNTEVQAPVKVRQEKVEANKASMTAGEMLTALENMGVSNDELLSHLESLDVDTEIKDPKALMTKFGAGIKDTRQYQTESPVINKTSEETTNQSSALLYRVLRVKPALDVLDESNGEKGQKVAQALAGYFKTKENLYGKYFDSIAKAAKGMEESGVKKVEKILLEENKTGIIGRDQLFGKQLKLYDTIRASLLQKQTEQIAAGQKVTAYDNNNRPFQRDAQVNPTYFPNKVSPKVIEIITEGKEGRGKLLQDFIDHQVANDDTNRPQEKKIELAKEKLDNLLLGFEGKSANQTKFNANRISEGVGLPDSWMRPGLLKNLSSYFNKASADRSFYDNVEAKPDIHTLLDPRNPEGIYHSAKDVMEQIEGEPFDKSDSMLKVSNRIATSAMLGPLTNIHISLSTFANALQYIKPLEAPEAYAHALGGMKGWYAKALETGYARHDLSSISDLHDANNTNIEKLREVANLIGKVGGRQLSDTMTKAFAQGFGDFVVRVRRVEANNGDKQAIAMMKQIDPQWSKNKVYTKQEYDQLASTFAGFLHGTHDARTLPTFMLKEGIIQPFLSLMSWSIAQTNQWMKHVWTPATTGNFSPLLMSTFGAVVGGYMIQQLRQKVADKKSAIPSLQEIAASKNGLAGNPELLAYNFMQMASYTGWAGIAATLGKDAFDLAYKNLPQGSTFPLDEAVEGSLETGGEAFSAMMQAHSAEDLLQIASKAAQDLVKENVQTARIVNNWAAASGALGESQQKQKTVNEASGDERRFEIANQLPYDQQILNMNNPYMHLDEKAFKRSSDLGNAAQMIPQLIQDEMNESGGNPEVLKEKLAGLKENSFQIMPNPEREPMKFARYYAYLQQVIGPEAAQQRMMQFMRQNAINHAKSSLIPSV